MGAPCDVIWFRRDLRLIDNELFASTSRTETCLCLYVLEPHWLEDRGRRLTPAQWSLLWASLMALRGNLLTRGSDLLVCVGEPERLLAPLMRRLGAERLRVHDGFGGNERETLKRVEAALPPDALEVVPVSPLFAMPTAVNEASALAFSSYLAAIEPLSALTPTTLALPVTLPPWPKDGPRGLPSLESLSLPGTGDSPPATLAGGEDSAQALIQGLDSGEIPWTGCRVNELLRALAVGCVSARRLYALCRSAAPVDSLPNARRRLRHELLWGEYLRWRDVLGADETAGPAPRIDPTGGCQRLYRPVEAAFETRPAAPFRDPERRVDAAPVAAPAAVAGSWYDRY